MGDIHGANKALGQCLERSGFDIEKDTLIQLGDVTDGYPEVFECVETLLNIKNLILIKGNHDDWFQVFTETDFHPQFWAFGGVGTIASYLKHAGKEGMYRASRTGYKTALTRTDIPETHSDFFAKQQLYHLDANKRLFVHGGIKKDIPLDRHRDEDFYWDRKLWEEALNFHSGITSQDYRTIFPTVQGYSEIFIGHTPTVNWGTDQPMHVCNLWNLDTGAGHSGRLTIMDVETKRYWQSDPVKELYSKNFRD